jgi:hypothetical protein
LAGGCQSISDPLPPTQQIPPNASREKKVWEVQMTPQTHPETRSMTFHDNIQFLCASVPFLG